VDLHLTPDQPTLAEKSAVEGELGSEGASSDRRRLLPALHAIQARVGHITPGALNYLAQRLDVAPAEIHGVASFYGMFSLTPRAPVVAHVCEDVACLAWRGDSVCRTREDALALERDLATKPLPGSL
jgi:NADH-quinone oxidoreductase subunit F